jgi:hypothetical protein
MLNRVHPIRVQSILGNTKTKKPPSGMIRKLRQANSGFLSIMPGFVVAPVRQWITD